MTWKSITVSNKIVGHISAGIYRSAGGALRELVSNAFDANASRVVITTNWPSFDLMTCYDDGDGISLDNFERIMTGGIGESDKRQDEENVPESLESGRPVIGRLGIGMLGIAQVCHEFKVIAHHRETETAFRASVMLEDFLRERVQKTEPERERLEIKAGRYSIEEIDYDPKQSGTYIVAADMRAAVIRKFRESSDTPLPSDFSSFVNRVHKHKSVRELGDYWEMVWELAVACPTPYTQEGPFDWGAVETSQKARNEFGKIKRSLEQYDFEVVVDGLSLRKPHFFPFPLSRRSGEPMSGQLFLLEQRSEVYGTPLEYSGYIYLQGGQAIEPMELRGLLIRIKNVAIGLYDPALLDYPKIEGPRFNWVSGEVYVDEGLEDALNIDRDSFNKLHSHFERLRRSVHERLKEVFSQAGKGTQERSQAQRQQQQAQKIAMLKELLGEELGEGYELLETEDSLPEDRPLVVDTEHRKVLVNTRSSLYPRARSRRDLAQLVAVAFEVSMMVPEPERRERFYKLLTRLLNI